jgi:uncharacterized coiled-coil DUF342 family protein
MSFYAHTCPDIDKARDSLIAEAEDMADKMRDINSAMRNEADSIIDALTEERDELLNEVKRLEAIIDDQDSQIKSLKDTP